MAPEAIVTSTLPEIVANREVARGKSLTHGLTSGAAAALGVLFVGALLWAAAPESGSRGETLARFVEWTPVLAHGFALNVLISLGAIAIGSVIGLAIGALALSSSFVGRAARLWVQAFRNAPWLVLIYFTTYVFPFEFGVFGTTLPFLDWLNVTLALALPASANIAEVFRGAVSSIPATQWEAASFWHSRAARSCCISSCHSAFAACCRRG